MNITQQTQLLLLLLPGIPHPTSGGIRAEPGQPPQNIMGQQDAATSQVPASCTGPGKGCHDVVGGENAIVTVSC
jgi:hypothetical protein